MYKILQLVFIKIERLICFTFKKLKNATKAFVKYQLIKETFIVIINDFYKK